jgi:hypothetical protein
MRCSIPEEILKIACRSGLEHCAAKKVVAAGGSSLAVKEPGMTSTSNCGAFANEFYQKVRHCTSMD